MSEPSSSEWTASKGVVAVALLAVLALAFFAIRGPTTNVLNPTGQAIFPALSASEIIQGSTLRVDINIDNVGDLYGAQLNVLYDSSVLEFVSISEGSFISENGAVPTAGPNAMPPSNSPGLISNIIVTRLGASNGASGAGTLVSITFKGIGVGSAAITPSDVILSNSQGQVISGQPVTTSTVMVNAPQQCPPAASNAFTGCYYSGRNFDSLVTSRTDPAINFDWGTGSPTSGVPSDQFSVKWNGQFNFEAAEYEFAVRADDGIRLFIDGQLVLDRLVDQSATTYKITQSMTPGAHNIRMDYYENAVDAVAQLSWAKREVAPAPVIDVTVPIINLMSPAHQEEVSGIYRLVANATDNIGVAYVEFLIDGIKIATLTTPSSEGYTFSWDTTKVIDGTHTITARALDAAGNSATTSVQVSVFNAAPIPVTFDPPSNLVVIQTTSYEVSLGWTAASSSSGISYYKVYRDNKYVGTSAQAAYTDKALQPSKRYNYQVSAVNGAGVESAKSNIATGQTKNAKSRWGR